LTFTFHPFAGPALRGQCLPFFGMWPDLKFDTVDYVGDMTPQCGVISPT